MAISIITRSCSPGVNRLEPLLPSLHRSDFRIDTNEIETHYDLTITAASVFNAKRDGCTTKAGAAASRAYQFRVNHYNKHYRVPEKRLHPILRLSSAADGIQKAERL